MKMILTVALQFAALIHFSSGQSSISGDDPKAERFVAQNSNLQNTGVSSQLDRESDYQDRRVGNYNSRYHNNAFDSKKKRKYPKYSQSFQSQSYVHDDLPFILMQTERMMQPSKMASILSSNYRQTATKTGNSNVIPRKYVDEEDSHLGLTKNEERVKIYYQNNPDLAPISIRQPGNSFDEPSPYKRMFNSFKTQRAGSIVGKRYG